MGQSVAQDIPSDRFITLNEGDQISLMCAYAYAVDFKDVTAAQPPKFRARTSKGFVEIELHSALSVS